MENEKFQSLVLSKFEENEQFQSVVLKQFQQVYEQLRDLKLGQTKLEANQLNLEANQLKLETKIEHDVIGDIRGLFDDRQVHLDYFKEIRESQVRMEGKLESLHHRVISQEFKLKDHEQELKKLRAGK